MAEEEELERIFTIPLRVTKQIPQPKRANYAVTYIYGFHVCSRVFLQNNAT